MSDDNPLKNLDMVIDLDPHAPPPRREVKRHTFHLETAIGERLRNAVFWTPGMTMTHAAEEAILDWCERFEAETNRGRPYKQRTGELKRGRHAG